MYGNHLPFPTWSAGNVTANSGTAFTQLVPPGGGIDGSPLIFQTDAYFTMKWANQGNTPFTHISRLTYTTGATAHKLTVMRPLNWTITAIPTLTGQTSIVLYDDPGIYSTNYKYPTPGGRVSKSNGGSLTQGGVPPCQVADHGITANDYIAYQLPDGTWFADIVASVSALTLTMTANVPAGTVATALPVGTIVFYFGVVTLKDPATGQLGWQTTTTATTSRIDLVTESIGGPAGLHPNDPLLVYSPNGTNAGILDVITAMYAKH